MNRAVVISLLVSGLSLVAAATEDSASSWTSGLGGLLVSCDNSYNVNDSSGGVQDSSTCRGIRIMRNFARRMLETAARRKDIQLLDGVNLVERENATGSQGTQQGRSIGDSVMSFLSDRELRIKLPKLLPSNYESVLKNGLEETGRIACLVDKIV